MGLIPFLKSGLKALEKREVKEAHNVGNSEG